MSPDDLRQLAHQLETDVGLITLLERLEFEAGPATFEQARREIDTKTKAAHLSGTSMVCAPK